MTSIAIANAAWRTSQLVQGVRDEQLAAPTPCGAMSVGDLLDHIATFGRVFTGAATKDPLASAGPDGPPSAANLADDWRVTTASRLMQLADAWSKPEAWTGSTNAGRFPTTGELAGAIALDELVVHGWDLSRATRQPYTVDEGTVALVHAFLTDQVGEGKPIPRTPIFAAAVPTSGDASALDTVIGLTGRDPSWMPDI